jgi:hypothetical protein
MAASPIDSGRPIYKWRKRFWTRWLVQKFASVGSAILEPVAGQRRRVRSVWTRPDKVAEDSNTMAPGREGVTKTADRDRGKPVPVAVSP